MQLSQGEVHRFANPSGRTASVCVWENKKHLKGKRSENGHHSVQELCEQGGVPGLSFPVPNLPLSLISHTVSVNSKAP